jgi:hypothetical protein
MSGTVVASDTLQEFQSWMHPEGKEKPLKSFPTNSGFPFMTKKLKGVGHLKKALKHNLREIVAEVGPYNSIEPTRIWMNVALQTFGTAEDTMRFAYETVLAAGIRPESVRKDGIWGIEIIFVCLPPNEATIETFYAECTRWAEEHFGIPVLSSVIHMDQGIPHCHVVLLPLKDKAMNGAVIHGYKKAMRDRLTNFYAEAGKHLGLVRPLAPEKGCTKTAQKRLFQFFAETTTMVEEHIHVIIKGLKDPSSILKDLGLQMFNMEKASSLTKLMTSQGCGT